MSRPLRIQYPDAWYHVMNRGRRGEAIFPDKKSSETFIDLLKELNKVYHVKIAAYCLMPNHYHLLVQTPEANLSRAMRHVNGVYTQRFNKYHRCDGQLFKGRYKAIVVDADTYLLELVRYIHRNPLEAGLGASLGEYQWSSHHGYVSNAKKWSWLHKGFILSLFSPDKAESIARYKQFVAKGIPEEITKILVRRKLPPVLGSKGFIEKIKGMVSTREVFEEIPESRLLTPDVDNIIDEVCAYYKVSETELRLSKRGYYNEPRNVGVYMLRQVRNDSLKTIGKVFEIEKYSTVSSIVERVKGEIRENRRFRKRIHELTSNLDKSQRQT